MITIFTPTFNRAYILPILYRSLEEQTCKDFEWLIVDDGSTDDTESLIQDFKTECSFPIKYFKKNNEGKHIAINYGLQEATGSLFFIVDSDDHLSENAIEVLLSKYRTIQHNKDIAGVAIGYRSIKKNGEIIYSKPLREHEMLLTHNDLVYKEGITGDFATAFKTNIQKQFPYPRFEGEKFFRESYVYRQIGKKYKTLYIDDPIYFADYLEDGLTAKSWQMLKKSPQGASLFFKELSNESIPITAKINALDSYWDFQLNDIRSSWIQKFRGVSFFLSLIVLFKRFFK